MLYNCFSFICRKIFSGKAGVHLKAVLTSLNTALSANISTTFQAMLNLHHYSHNHCFAVLCKFWSNFWSFWERDVFFFSKHRLN